MRDLLSIIICTYKQLDYLYDTIDSALQQNYFPIELIVVDDGTPNFCVDAIEKYIVEHKSENIVKYIVDHHRNMGTVKNINRGILLCSGDYIKIIAGDDVFYDAEVARKQIELLKKTNLLVATGKCIECDRMLQVCYKEQTENTNAVLTKVFNLTPKECFKACRVNNLFPIVTQALCLKKEFFDIYGLFDERYVLVEDLPMAKRIITAKIQVAVLDNYVVKHRSAIGVSNNQQLFCQRQKQYYLDMANYVKWEELSQPDLFPKCYTYSKYRAYVLRYELSICNSKLQKYRLVLRNIHIIILFAIFQPRNMMSKIKRLFIK